MIDKTPSDMIKPKKKEVRIETPAVEDSTPEITDKTDKTRDFPYLNVPPLTEVNRPATDARVVQASPSPGPAYKTMAPVQAQIKKGQLTEDILDKEITIKLRTLYGYSNKLCDEFKEEITPVRVPIKVTHNPVANFMMVGPENGHQLREDHRVANDPYWQFYQNGEKEVPLVRYVGGESESLRSI